MDPNFHTTPINILFDKFKKNFEDTYNSNRAPRGFYLHWRYLSNNGDFDMVNIDKKSFIVNFYHWLVTEHKNGRLRLYQWAGGYFTENLRQVGGIEKNCRF